MSKNIKILYLVLIFVSISGIFVTLSFNLTKNNSDQNQIVCTADAKMCPDGSYVGRTGPKCDFAACPNVDKNVTKINQKIELGNINITPLEVVSDSRCPSGVQCIWAGTVVLKVKLEKGAIVKEVDMEIEKSIIFEGEEVSLVSVSPEKNQKEILSSDYNFTFSVSLVATISKSKISGRVTISPTCPVERIPPDPKCAPKGFETTVSVTQGSKSIILSEAKTDKNGNYVLELDPGEYTLNIFHGKILPSCLPVDVVVNVGKNQKIDINCDSGIR